MKKILLIGVGLLCQCFSSLGQSKEVFLVNSKFSYAENPALNKHIGGKKVILDLFNSGCVVCFRMLPKVKELQELFPAVHFILIGDEDGTIRRVYSKFEKKLDLRFPVFYDSVFFSRFDIRFVPRYLWLDEKGVIQAITGPEDVTASNITFFLADQTVITSQPPANEQFSRSRLLLIDGNGGADTSFLFRSLLTLYGPNQRPHMPPVLAYDSSRNFFQAIGTTMADLYRYAYFGRTNWNSRDPMYVQLYRPLIFLGGPPDSVLMRTRYSYSFKPPFFNRDVSLFQKALQNDLSTFFGYEVIVTNLKVPCWKLIALPGAAEKLKTKSTISQKKASYAGYDYKNVPVSEIIAQFYMMRLDDYPYIDDTGISFNIDVKVDAILTDPVAVNVELQKQGLQVIKGEKEMTVLLLSDEKKTIAVR